MFQAHFGLKTNPFGLSPRLDFLYRSSTFQESMAHLLYGLEHGEAIVMITGQIGTGKTTAIQSFLTDLGLAYSTALITNTRVNSLELLKLILEDLGVSFASGIDKSDALILFKDFLLAESRAGRRVIIVVDEAQNLEPDVLEEIRLLTNLGQGDSQPVQLVLLGQPELLDRVNSEGLAQLRQRIRVHYKLDTLSRAELSEYVSHRMMAAGGQADVFSDEALDRIWEFSNGIPRLVNSLASNGLLSAFVSDRFIVQAVDIDPSELMGAQDIEKPVLPDPPQKPLAEITSFPEKEAAANIESKASSGPNPEPVSTENQAPENMEERRAPQETGTPEEKSIPEFPAEASAPSLSGSDLHLKQGEESEFQLEAKPRRRTGFWLLLIILLVLIFLAGGYYFGAFDSFLESQKWRSNMMGQGQGQDLAESAELPFVEKPSQPTSPADSTRAVPVAVDFVPGLSSESLAIIPSSPSRFAVHIASFRTQEKADLIMDQVRPFASNLFSEDSLVDGIRWYRVYLGPYSTREDAKNAISDLDGLGEISYHTIWDLKGQ